MKRAIQMRKQPAWAVIATLLATLAAHAAVPQTVTLKDRTGRGFAPDLVNYTIPAPADGAKGLRVLDAAGQSLPAQFTPGDTKTATISFVAAIPPGGKRLKKDTPNNKES
jgi:hypothetical protein